MNLPSSLETLTFGEEFTQSLQGVTLTSALVRFDCRGVLVGRG